METTINAVPQEVINALREVRESGIFNMFDRSGVIDYIDAILEYDENVLNWLSENKSRYVEALEAMGKQLGDERRAKIIANESAPVSSEQPYQQRLIAPEVLNDIIAKYGLPADEKPTSISAYQLHRDWESLWMDRIENGECQIWLDNDPRKEITGIRPAVTPKHVILTLRNHSDDRVHHDDELQITWNATPSEPVPPGDEREVKQFNQWLENRVDMLQADREIYSDKVAELREQIESLKAENVRLQAVVEALVKRETYDATELENLTYDLGNYGANNFSRANNMAAFMSMVIGRINAALAAKGDK